MIQRFHYTELTSTNDYAKELIKHLPLIAVSADSQTNGRGRNNRTWEGETHKNLFLSIAINHKNYPTYKYPSRYQALGCLVVYNALVKYISKDGIKLKYPNDIYIFDRQYKKVSGILIEHSIQGKVAENTIIGVGLNINQDSFSDELSFKASSLKKIGLSVTIEDIYNDILLEFENLFTKREDYIYDLWVEKLNILNKSITLLSDNKSYLVKGINPDCSLTISDAQNNIKRIDNGDSIIYEL